MSVLPDSDGLQMQQDRDFYKELLALGSQQDLMPLLERALELIIEVTRARKGYLSLYSDPDDRREEEWWIARSCSGEDVAEIRARISRGIIAEALAGGVTVETAEALSDERFRERKSVRAHRIRAALCAPVGNPPIGVVYLQGRVVAGAFTAADRERAELFARQLTPLADRLLSQRRRREEADATRAIRETFHCPEIIGRSAALASVLRTASLLAPLDIDVLLTGPSGTGKTAMARTIHHNSARASRPFVEINCANIPDALFESEFFGFAEGAHSEARRARGGKIEAAEGSTLFLDEVGELSLAVQSKLLSFLQSREYFRLGESRPRRADVRIISATNQDLHARVAQGLFRQDLLYRLEVMPLEMPPLAARGDDIVELTRRFCRASCERCGFRPLEVSRQALLACREAPWPGNIRELENKVLSAVIRANGENSATVEVRHLFPSRAPRAADDEPDQPRSIQEAMRDFQRRFVADALDRNDWHVTETARQLGIARSHLYNLINAHGLERRREPGDDEG